MEPDVLEHILDGRMKPTNLQLALLRNITGHFSEEQEIGRGGFATVYKGVLPNGNNVAVKRLMNSHTIDDKLFYREVDSLLMINHQNIVRFLGYCASTDLTAIKVEGSRGHIYAEVRERLLCFEYISNGSLQKHITDELRGLEWNTRYRIIREICEGLQYLHMEKHIYHMDLKPANILLDDDMVPKITDFGLSRLDEKSQTMSVDRRGSLGYCAPEYRCCGKMSFKSDMYGLGTIIIELVTGEKDIPDNNKNNVLRRWRHRWKKTGKETPLGYEQVTKCLEIGLLCQEIDPCKRPFIWEIINDLDKMEYTIGQVGTANESTVGQISPFSGDDMLGIEPLELYFPFELDKQMSCSLQLTNDTDSYIAFNIEKMSPLLCCIQPDKGIVVPQSKCSVGITMQLWDKAPRDMRLANGFIVRSTKVNNGLAVRDITVNMFNKGTDNIVDELILDVVFDARLQWVLEVNPLEIAGKRYQELMKLLSEGDNETKNKLRIVSVVGFGGLGKTTLVKTVYDKIKGGFDCSAFVSNNQNANAKNVLIDILLDLGMCQSQLTMLDERKLIEKLQESLDNKRYLIIIDDIWDEKLWKVIKWAFSSNNNFGSRIITTTRVVSVSKFCCSSTNDSVYQLVPLSDEDSQRLFYKIGKDRLIWMWIAEGFVKCENTEAGLFEIGETYFNELMNRNMIQPVHDNEGTVEACRVHDMVLDLMYSLSSEGFDTCDSVPYLSSILNINRTMSLQNIRKEKGWQSTHLDSMGILQVSSVDIFQHYIGRMPPLSSICVLGVLDLIGCYLADDDNLNLQELGNLFHLRYLSLAATGISKVPEEIGKLQFLQVLDLSLNPGIRELPSAVIKPRKLMCLRIDSVCEMLPDGMGNLTSMEELSDIHGDSLSTLKELGNMKSLRKLGIMFDNFSMELEKAFVESLGKLSNIESLEIGFGGWDMVSADILGECWVPPPSLQEFFTRGDIKFSTLPAWIRRNPSHLSRLSMLEIYVDRVQQKYVKILGRLPALRSLVLSSLRQSVLLLVSADGFHCLTSFELFSHSPGEIIFQAGAMPKAKRVVLNVGLRVLNEEVAGNLGLGNLPSLRDVRVYLHHRRVTVGQAKQTEAALKKALRSHLNCPTFDIIFQPSINNQRAHDGLDEAGHRATKETEEELADVVERMQLRRDRDNVKDRNMMQDKSTLEQPGQYNFDMGGPSQF